MATKVKHTPRRRKLFFISTLAFILVLAVGSYGIYYFRYRNKNSAESSSTRPVNSVNYGPSSPADSTANNNRKAEPSPSPTLTDQQPSSTSNSTVSVKILNATLNNGDVHVGTFVGGVTSGTCALTASQQGQQTVTLATSSVKQDVNNYDCGVYNIATSQFPASGTWILTLTVTSGGNQASDTANVTIPSGS